MSRVIAGELGTVAVAFFSGVLITVVYDVLRVFRRVIAHGNVWIGIEDCILWIWTSLWTFSVMYRENDGSLRMYTILTMVLGMIVYHQTISEPLVRFLGSVFRKLFRFFLYPFKVLKNYIIFWGKKLKKLFNRLIMK